MDGSRPPRDRLGETLTMQTWRVTEDLKLNPDVDYINDCCKFCDAVLEKIKPAVAEKSGVPLNEIVIDQEDWGWYLEFQKGEIVYILNISYWERDESGAHNFGVDAEAQKIKKGFIFDRRIDAEKECREFAEQIEAIARQNKIEVSED
jgi:hypothetical protein